MRGNLAKVLVEKGDYDRAESQLRAAIAADWRDHFCKLLRSSSFNNVPRS
jgi:predicted negative regulator of RcsB-dependent stress response